jgi:hypothetical protein
MSIVELLLDPAVEIGAGSGGGTDDIGTDEPLLSTAGAIGLLDRGAVLEVLEEDGARSRDGMSETGGATAGGLTAGRPLDEAGAGRPRLGDDVPADVPPTDEVLGAPMFVAAGLTEVLPKEVVLEELPPIGVLPNEELLLGVVTVDELSIEVPDTEEDEPPGGVEEKNLLLAGGVAALEPKELLPLGVDRADEPPIEVPELDVDGVKDVPPVEVEGVTPPLAGCIVEEDPADDGQLVLVAVRLEKPVLVPPLPIVLPCVFQVPVVLLVGIPVPWVFQVELVPVPAVPVPWVLQVLFVPLTAAVFPCVFHVLPVVVPPATVLPCVFQLPGVCAMPPGGTVVRTFCDRVFSHPVSVTPARNRPARPSTGFLPIGIPLPRKR